ncbi:MAG: hypothetical protein GX600_00700 [Dehalococcoidia bacterium]|jgi:hypothetical protein|nr:hypothetical protein [Dehalococcoidia bacterium]
MEFAAAAVGVVAALAGLIIVLVVLTRVVHVRLLEHGLISSRGVAWLALGVASMAVFGLLHISPLIPLPVALVGVFLLVRDAHRGSRKDN